MSEQGATAPADVAWWRWPVVMLLAGVVLLVVSIVACGTMVSWVEEVGLSWQAAMTLVCVGVFVGHMLAMVGLLLVCGDGDKAVDPLDGVREELAGLRQEMAALRVHLEGHQS